MIKRFRYCEEREIQCESASVIERERESEREKELMKVNFMKQNGNNK